jgi:hypothetical protein
MAIGWLTVLKMVPWGDVIVNAPKIADGAVKLWNTVARKQAAAVSPATGQAELSAEAQSIVMLQAQLSSAEAQIADLHNQMLASSELITALANQSTYLVKRIEVNRIRVLWLAGIMFVLLAITVINLIVTLAP